MQKSGPFLTVRIAGTSSGEDMQDHGHLSTTPGGVKTTKTQPSAVKAALQAKAAAGQEAKV